MNCDCSEEEELRVNLEHIIDVNGPAILERCLLSALENCSLLLGRRRVAGKANGEGGGAGA